MNNKSKKALRKSIKKMQRQVQTQKGITLVALVITIIILIILATVAINFAFGNNGLIQRAEDARDYYANDTSYTDESITNVESYLDEIINGIGSGNGGSGGEGDTFEPQPTPEPEGGGTAMSDMTNGVIEIKWLSGTTDNVSNEPNAPVIKTDLPSGTTMELVRYTGIGTTEQERWVAGEEYSYTAGIGSQDNTQSKWANARVTIDGIDSYFVWIPRYAYRIIYFDSAESKKAYQEGTLTEETAVTERKIIGYSDSRGIVDAQGRKIESVTSESNSPKTMVSEDYFMVHPAFTDEEENGGWDSQLAGVWIGKYEASLANKADGSNIVTNSLTDGDILLADHTDKTIVTKPGYSSWRYIAIGNMYTNSLAYDTNLQSHMLKNSEWGAVAYLTESKYGRNGTEIGFSDEGYITGGGTDNAYATTNQDQSSTGNVYGIYDLRGGAYEYVASYYNGSTSSKLTNNGGSFASNGGTSTKYATAYTGISASSAYKYGDATYETRGWHSDNASFVDSNFPFFCRGGGCGNAASNAGVFCFFSPNSGSAAGHNSFRLALAM